ncbi:hypothetical protein [Chryseobacterium sp. FH1]|uniref:hypothetical protein n=1 Tax=Chryseobacterium sp. FH1 TaxID=1233951 RepID=UPI0004E35AEB|nr:hypothetical protein [Chryseobacterium sp. FH1]KFC19376.1 hypothetical protein IO90_08730 [Chryseobacterium sp. FH1]
MKKLLLVFSFLFSILLFSQIDSLIEFNSVKVYDDSFIGLEVIALPRSENDLTRNFPIELFSDGKFQNSKNSEEYIQKISGKKFKIYDLKTTEKSTEFYFTNNETVFRWRKSNLSYMNYERFLLSSPFYERIKKKISNQTFVYADQEFQFDNNSNIDSSAIKKFVTKSIDFYPPNNKGSRTYLPLIIASDINNKETIFNVFDFSFNKYYKGELYDLALELKALKEKRKQIIEKKENEIRYSSLIKKYGKSIGQKIFEGEIWIGMNRQMLLDSKGKPTRIGLITETKYGTSSQYIYEDEFFKTLTYVYLENGKVNAIQYN